MVDEQWPEDGSSVLDSTADDITITTLPSDELTDLSIFKELPDEILIKIIDIGYLECSLLIRDLIQVCHLWRDISMRHRYYHLELDDPNHTFKIEYFEWCHASKRDIQLAKLLSVLYLHIEFDSQFYSLFNNGGPISLRSLSLTYHKSRTLDSRKNFASLECFKSAKELTICDNMCMRERHWTFSNVFCKSLTTLNFKSTIIDSFVWDLVSGMCPNVMTMNLYNSAFIIKKSNLPSKALPMNVKKLIFEENETASSLSSLNHMLASFSNSLQDLKVITDRYIPKEFFKFLKKCTKLIRISIVTTAYVSIFLPINSNTAKQLPNLETLLLSVGSMDNMEKCHIIDILQWKLKGMSLNELSIYSSDYTDNICLELADHESHEIYQTIMSHSPTENYKCIKPLFSYSNKRSF